MAVAQLSETTFIDMHELQTMAVCGSTSGAKGQVPKTTFAAELNDATCYLVARNPGIKMVNMVVLNPCREKLQTFWQRYIGATPHGIGIAAVEGLPRFVAPLEGVLQVE